MNALVVLKASLIPFAEMSESRKDIPRSPGEAGEHDENYRKFGGPKRTPPQTYKVGSGLRNAQSEAATDPECMTAVEFCSEQ